MNNFLSENFLELEHQLWAQLICQYVEMTFFCNKKPLITNKMIDLPRTFFMSPIFKEWICNKQEFKDGI